MPCVRTLRSHLSVTCNVRSSTLHVSRFFATPTAASFPSLAQSKKTSPNTMTSKTKTFCERTLSTGILLIMLGCAIYWDSAYGYAILICIFCNLTSIEWFRMLKGRKGENNRWLALIAGLAYPWIMAVGVLAAQDSNTIEALGSTENLLSMTSDFAFIEISLALLVLYTLIAFFCELYRMDYKGYDGQQALSSLGITLLSFIYPVWLFAFALYSLLSPESTWNLLWLLLVTKMSDIWAYLSGVLMGGRFFRRRFSPTVSPKKTWEGIIGSFIITTVCAYGLLFMTEFPFHLTAINFFCIVMPCIFIFSVAGDLAGSLVKRGLAVKDSGSLLPGIGGIFDLIDSPAFTISLFVAVLHAL